MEDSIKCISYCIIKVVKEIENSSGKSSANSELSKILNEIEDHLLSLPKTQLANVSLNSVLDVEYSSTTSVYGKNIIRATLQCLSLRWETTILIDICIYACQKALTTVKCCADYKLILNHVNKIICLYQAHANKFKSNAILLSLHQMRICLPILLDGLINCSNVIIRYSVGCLQQCLNKISEEMYVESPLPHSEFINLMDFVLRKLDDISKTPSEFYNNEKHLEELQKICDDILSHAMNTVQVVTFDEDKLSITASSQKILKDLKEVNLSRLAMNTNLTRLHVTSLSNSLCQLERSVNSAVLRLVSIVTSGFDDPFRQIMDTIKTSKGSSSSDLEDLIANFDLYMDRIIQIGMFAVSCTSNLTKALQIRCCLASFESLESELVPNMTAFYVDRSDVNKTNLRILTDFWLDQLNTFKNLLYSIVDPVAFTETIKLRLHEFSQMLLESDENKNFETLFKEFIKVGKTLIKVLQIEKEIFPDRELTLNSLITEIKCCERYLAVEQPQINRQKMKVRAENILKIVDEIYWKLIDDIEENGTTSVSFKLSIKSADSDYYKLCPEPNICLTPYINNALSVKKESAFYETPKRHLVKPKVSVLADTPQNLPTANRVRNSCFRTAKCTKSTPMDLTAILLNLSTNYDDKSPTSVKEGKKLPKKIDFDDIINDTLSVLTMSGIETPERFDDLLKVDLKIKNLLITNN